MQAGILALKALRNFFRFKTGSHAPLFASFSVTGRCNLMCTYCDWWRTSIPELPTSKALVAIDNVCNSSVAFFDLSGGEPLLREDLAVLAKRASSHNCLVSMNTNGTLLKKTKASQIADAFDVITVSIDGPEEIHDRIRGVAGTYRRAVEAIKLLKTHGVMVGVNTVISPWNLKALPKFIDELRSFVDFVQLQPIHPYPPPPKNKLPLEEILKLQDYLIGLKHKDPSFLALPTDFIQGFRLFFEGKVPKICHAGKLYVSVNPSGMLLACAARGDVVLGNVLEHSVSHLLKNEGARDCWLKVASCRGCWLECTVGVSMIVKEPFKEAANLASYFRRLQF